MWNPWSVFPNEIGVKLEGFEEVMCDSLIWVGDNVIIEGEAILPSLARKLMDRYPEKVKVCLLGYSEIDVERQIQ